MKKRFFAGLITGTFIALIFYAGRAVKQTALPASPAPENIAASQTEHAGSAFPDGKAPATDASTEHSSVADISTEDTSIEDTSITDTSIEDTPMEDTSITDTGESEENTPLPAPKRVLTDDELTEQLKLILQNKSLWLDAQDACDYMITDLDRNGRVELIAAACSGTMMLTTADIYEVTEDLSGLAHCRTNLDETDDFSDILVNRCLYFYDEDASCYRYVLSNVTRLSSFESIESTDTISLLDGSLTLTSIARLEISVDEVQGISYAYTDIDHNEITENAFYTAVNTVYPHLSDLSSCSFEWFSSSQCEDTAALASSYHVFIKDASRAQ